MILEFKRYNKRKGAAHKRLAEKVMALTAEVEMKALTAEKTLKVKNPDEITEAEELVTALRQQCEVQVATAAVWLRKGPAEAQVALDTATCGVKVGKIKVGWSVCHLTFHEPPEVCFRCLEPEDKSRDCKGPDRIKLCTICGADDEMMTTGS